MRPELLTPYDSLLTASWRSLTLRGVLTLGLGVAALLLPRLTVQLVVMLFGAFALAEGLVILGNSMSSDGGGWGSGLAGVSGVIVGLVAFLAPVATAYALVLLLATWAIVTGTLEVAAAVRLRYAVAGSWALGFSGLLSVMLGVILLTFPGPGLEAVTRLLGAFAAASGVVYLGLAWRFRSLSRPPGPPVPPPATPEDQRERELAGRR